MNKTNRRVLGIAGLFATSLAWTSAANPAAAVTRGGGSAHVQNARSDISSGNRNVNANSNRNVNTNVNRNTNVNVNRDVNVHTHGGYDHWGHPIATAAAVTATAVAVGTVAATLPASGCSVVSAGGVAYQQCGANYYQPVYQGGGVQYVVVNPP